MTEKTIDGKSTRFEEALAKTAGRQWINDAAKDIVESIAEVLPGPAPTHGQISTAICVVGGLIAAHAPKNSAGVSDSASLNSGSGERDPSVRPDYAPAEAEKVVVPALASAPTGTAGGEAEKLAQRPKWISGGAIDWKSFEKYQSTDIRVRLPDRNNQPSYQHVITLDWGNYGSQLEAEEAAQWVVAALSASQQASSPTVPEELRAALTSARAHLIAVRGDPRQRLPNRDAIQSAILNQIDDALSASAHKADGADGWLPIETAPRDGGYLIANANGEVAFCDVRNGSRCVHNMAGYVPWSYGSPATHWRPLPAAPGADAKEKA